MLIKWILCKTDEENREAFSRAQEMWKALEGVNGFLGQIGGWEISDRHLACIAGFWRDRESYERFMRKEHDRIFAQSRQERMYHSIQVFLSSRLLDMPGGVPSLQAALEKASLLRVTDCTVRPGHEERFLHAQKTVWFPAMREEDGMLGGTFTLDVKAAQLYRIFTLWRDEETHLRWTETMVRPLLKAAGTERDAETAAGRVVRLEPKWTVVGK